MLESIDHLDRAFFFVLNGTHTPLMDQLMWYASKMMVWSPVYVFLLYLIYKKLGSSSFLLSLLFIALLLFLTDFVSVHGIKNTVMRLRPTYNPEVMDRVKLVLDANGNYYRGGRFGFFSNHASNYFGVAVFFFLLMKPMRRLHVLFLFVWVTTISYSRIYLGVHYPGDVLAGALYGSIMAFFVYKLFLFFNQKYIMQK